MAAALTASWVLLAHGALALGVPRLAAGSPAPAAATSLPEGSTARWAPPDRSALEDVMQRARARPLAERLVVVTEPFVGAPYQLNPLGEGEGPDPDPRLRTDVFDCTTFVETGLAMSLAESADELEPVLDLIRYREGAPGYQNRRHFPEAEWIPDLIAIGLLKDVTREAAGKDVVVAKKRLDRATWDRRHRRILHELDDERIPFGEASLEVWPIEKAKLGYKRIPPGTVLSVVRSDRAHVPVRVSHQGLVVEKGGKLYLRHAANKVYARVVDEPLGQFLARNAKYKKWPVTGVHLARVQEPGPKWREQAKTARR